MSFCSWGGEKYRNHFDEGIYVCVKCGHALFHSNKKFAHSSPWPAFSATIHPNSVSKREDDSPTHLKVSCGNCGNGLGHEFVGENGGKSRF